MLLPALVYPTSETVAESRPATSRSLRAWTFSSLILRSLIRLPRPAVLVDLLLARATDTDPALVSARGGSTSA